MRYTSTRDGTIDSTFEQALFAGYAPDGGLFVPRTLPVLTADRHLVPWSKLSYADLACEIVRLFVSTDEVSDVDLKSICDRSFGEGCFDDDDNDNDDKGEGGGAVPVRRVGSVFVAELFHGPTFCFKDLGMRPVINLLSHFATKRKRRTTLLVSTTGDTGPAAVQAVHDTNDPYLTLLVHYPQGQISDFQRRQMTTVNSPCVRIAAFEGGGDDMDGPIKRIILGLAASECPDAREDGGEEEDGGEGVDGGGGSDRRRSFCGVNSYNVGRPLMQCVHFVWIYLRVAEQLGVSPGDPDAKIDIILPTGAMGNMAGGYIAKRMGIPIGLLCAGVNINDITHRVIETGKFHRSECMEKTLSEAINIQVPYNFERLLFYLTNGNHGLVRKWMSTMDSTHKLDLDKSWLAKLREEFRSARVTDDEMSFCMKQVCHVYAYVADPHTSVAIAAAEKLGYNLSAPNKTPVVILSTASPCKFQEAVTVSLGEDGWKQYKMSHFPKRAGEVVNKQEICPSVYRWKEGSTLTDVQLEWEQHALSIIAHVFVS